MGGTGCWNGGCERDKGRVRRGVRGCEMDKGRVRRGVRGCQRGGGREGVIEG